jgi:RHS repeat-associated protein
MPYEGAVATDTLDHADYALFSFAASLADGTASSSFISLETPTTTQLSSNPPADVVYAFLNARYYNNSVGRFMAQDPMFTGDPNQQRLLDPQQLNSYSYARNNPINESDPSGEALSVSQVLALSRSGPLSVSQVSTLASGGTVNGVTNPTGSNFSTGGGGSGVSTPSSGGGGVQLSVSSGGSAPVSAPAQGALPSGAGGSSQSSSGVGSSYAPVAIPSVAILGSIWQNGNNGGQMINGIYYFDHALDRMAPKGLWLAEKGKEGSRGVPPSVVKNAIKYGVQSAGNLGRTVFTYENVRVIVGSSQEAAKLGLKTAVVVSVILLGQ